MKSVTVGFSNNITILHEFAKHRVSCSNDVIAVLFSNHHRGLELDDVAMDTICQNDDLVIQKHPALSHNIDIH